MENAFGKNTDTIELSASYKEIIGSISNDCFQDDFFFLRLQPALIQQAMYNNYRAYTFARGYAPAVHDKYLSSDTLPKILSILVRKITGNATFDGVSDDKITELKDAMVKWNEMLTKATIFMLERGEALVVFDIIDGKIIFDTYPLSRYETIEDRKSQVIEANLYTTEVSGELMSENYVIYEHRFLKDNKTYREFRCKRVVSTGTDWTKSKVNDLDADTIPDKIRAKFSDIEFYKSAEIPSMPLGVIGVYRLKNTAVNRRCPYSGIGESQFIDVLNQVFEYDQTNTYKDLDKTIGRGKVLLPKVGTTITPKVPLIRSNMIGAKSSNISLDDFMENAKVEVPDYTFIKRLSVGNADDFKPESIQFNLRIAEWNTDLAFLTTLICVGCGLSPEDYDPTLSVAVKTATEVNYLKDITKGTVNDKRKIISEVLNPMLNDIAIALGIEIEGAFIKWDKTTVLNDAENNSIVLQRYQCKLMSRRSAVKALNPNWSDKEIDDELEQISRETENENIENSYGSLGL